MRWKKLGVVFETPTQLAWARTHAQLPFAERRGDLFRVRFSSRDELGRARIGSFDLDLRARRVVGVRPTPEIDLGPLGSFDDRGVTASWLVEHGGAQYQYYTGWNLGVTVPFYLGIGLAVSTDDGQTFEKVGGAPVLGRSAHDPYLTASPAVLVEGGVWRMWYVSCVRWVIADDKPLHHYNIRYAESKDGITWTPSKATAIDFKSADEYAISRPTVLKDGSTYRMWYAHRASPGAATYRIGYAESSDGVSWQRHDERAGISISSGGWDSEMICYPHVFDFEGERYMLYNGNGYSRTGVGLALLEPHT
jgi:hypothetical protein